MLTFAPSAAGKYALFPLILLLIFLLFLTLMMPGLAAAQYPARPIRLIVTIPPGGAPDIVARALGEKLAGYFSQPVVVENRAGSNGNIAGDMVARAAPDGHVLLLATDSLITINPHLYPHMNFSTLRDLVPVATLASNQFVLSVHPGLPVGSLREFIDYARRASPPLVYASGGNGSQHHLSMELLKARAGIDLVHVPYKGGAPATLATVAGQVAAMFAGTSTAPQIRAGKLRALATTGAKRSNAFPELPAIAELYPGYEVGIWLALFGPSGMPDAVHSRLRAAVGRALGDAELKSRFANAGGLEVLATSPEEFDVLIRRDYAKYGKTVKDAGISLD